MPVCQMTNVLGLPDFVTESKSLKKPSFFAYFGQKWYKWKVIIPVYRDGNHQHAIYLGGHLNGVLLVVKARDKL